MELLEKIDLGPGMVLAAKVLYPQGIHVCLEARMQTFFSDLSYAVRQLRKTPGLALLAILTLALGVGANTAIFTVIESVLLRPLPYAHSDRLLYIGPAGDKPGFGSTS